MPDVGQKLSVRPQIAELTQDVLFYVVDPSASGLAASKYALRSQLDGRYLLGANNLSDVANAATARTNLGLGSMAIINDAPSDGNQYARQDAAWAAVAGGVISVFGRTGAVVAAIGDYTAAQVTNAAAINAANVFTTNQKINVNSATALVVEQDGVKDNVLVVDTANGRVGVGGVPGATAQFEIQQSADNIGFTIWGYDDQAAAYGKFYINQSGTFTSQSSANILFLAGGGGYFRGTVIEFNDTVAGNVLFARGGGRGGVGIITPLAKFHIDQPSTTAAIPVLTLDQADLSEEFIRFVATVGAGNPIDTAALGAYYGKIRVYVEGVGAKWLSLYD